MIGSSTISPVAMDDQRSAKLVSLVIIDDNPRSLEFVSSALARDGLAIYTASDPAEGLDLVYTHRAQIVITDLVMPGITGLEVLSRIMEFDPAIDVILMTAHYTSETAVEAIRKGAADYLNKPVPLQLLRDRVGRLIEAAFQRGQVAFAEDELSRNAQFEGIVGRSPQMWELFARIRRVAPHYRSVLITGETGTGKDLVAQALHKLSGVTGRFVVLNCSAVVETLFESELFGHARGAFTGADRDKAGMVEHAAGGTLFLDEIGDMPLATQAKLLRVLQNHEVLRVGSLNPLKVDVRVVAATNRDLRQAIADRRFREDLFYRLSMVEIRVPRVNERLEDLPLLTRHFVAKFNRQYDKQIRGLTQRAQIVLGRHGWPGNVRELENVIGHAAMMTMGETIDVNDFPDWLQHAGSGGTGTSASGSGQSFIGGATGSWFTSARGQIAGSTAISASKPMESGSTAAPGGDSKMTTGSAVSFEEHEKKLLTETLARTHGNQAEAARQLHIGRDALRYKMKKHGLL